MKNETQALYYQALEDDAVRCDLCIHRCLIQPGQRGTCGIRENDKGILYALADGRWLVESIDPIEKKPLLYYKNGTWIYSIGTAGCNLSCDYCQNWQLVEFPNIKSLPKISDEVVLERAASQGSIGIAFTYNEPTINYESVLRLSKKAKERGLVTACISNGQLLEEPMRELAPFIDAWNIDLKSIDPYFYKQVCHGSLARTLANIKIAHEHSHVEVTHLVVTPENEKLDQIEHLAKELAQIDPDLPLHLSRYFPAYKRAEIGNPTSLSFMEEAQEIARHYLNTVSLGNV